jgi:ribonuclease HI
VTRHKISVYADGSSTGRLEGATGWGWLVIDWTDDKIVCAGSEGSPNGSNSTAELQAAICGLRAVMDRNVHVGNDVTLISDSQYALNLANGSFKAHKHQELVKSLQALVGVTGATTQWVKGHSGDPFNCKVDALAKAGKDRYSPPKGD